MSALDCLKTYVADMESYEHKVRMLQYDWHENIPQ